MTEDNDGPISKKEMYAMLLKEFEEFPDEGRQQYLEEILAELRKDLESMD